MHTAHKKRKNTYLDENHGGDLLGGEGLGLTEVLDLDLGVAGFVNDLEGPALHILLDGGVVEAATDETPRKGVELLVFLDRVPPSINCRLLGCG